MRRAAWVVIAVGCAACNGLFGLDPTADEPGADRDGDGVADTIDNCPDVANADQRDTDGDGLGDACDSCPNNLPTRDRDGDGIDDACDPCVLGPNHDEDGDGVFDACDVCPGIADPAQSDDDGDGIGNACDGDENSLERVRFDAFTRLDARWQSNVPWQLAATGDTITPSANDPDGLVDASEIIDGDAAIEIGVTLSASIPAGETLGAVWSGDSDDRCTITCAPDCAMLLVTSIGMNKVTFAPPTGFVRLVFAHTLRSGLRSAACTLTGATDAPVIATLNSGSGLVTAHVLAGPSMEVTYVDITH